MECRWDDSAAAVGCYFESSSGGGEMVMRPQVKWQVLRSMLGLPNDYEYPY